MNGAWQHQRHEQSCQGKGVSESEFYENSFSWWDSVRVSHVLTRFKD